MLLDALWDTHRVDEGRDSGLYDEHPQFAGTLARVADDLGVPWARNGEDVWATYHRDCYTLRNETAHEGRTVSAEDLDAALDAYDALRRAVEELTVATRDRFPRTALLVHGAAGLERAGVLHGRVLDELEAARAEGALAFWLPHDLRAADGGGPDGQP